MILLLSGVVICLLPALSV